MKGIPANSKLSLGAFHLSELTSQPIPIVMRISLITKTNHPDQSKYYAHKGDGFPAKPLGKRLFHYHDVWPGYVSAGQF